MIMQWTWEVLQTVLGWLIAFIYGVYREDYRGRILVRTKKGIAVSLGRYIILVMNAPRTAVSHEYGHCRQSRMLGPLYLIVVGIPSILRAGIGNILWLRCGWTVKELKDWYHRGYPEKWANKLGRVNGKG